MRYARVPHAKVMRSHEFRNTLEGFDANRMRIAISHVKALAPNAQSRVPHVEMRSASTSSASVATPPRSTYTASDRPLVRRPTK